MKELEIVAKYIDEKVQQLRDFMSDGRCENFEDYKRISGEIRGLLIAKGYAIDLKQTMEKADE
jgi:hypothetical protein